MPDSIPEDFPKERAAFARELPRLLATHPNEYVVIIGDEVVGLTRTMSEAFELGTATAHGTNFFAERVHEDAMKPVRLLLFLQ